MNSTGTPVSNRQELSVSELSRAIKGTLEQQFGRILVRGEINSLARPSSGHLYFSLVDPLDNTRIQAACWKGSASKLKMKPEDGQEVIVTARLTAYGARSQYQLIVENIELAGIGALLKMLEERRVKLAKEGLFDAERKRPLPKLPKRIGVITSEKGAVWQDILHRVQDRFPVPITLCPVLVQGEHAPKQIIAAIAAMDSLAGDARPDIVIIARGGGSMEDLLPFHDEGIIRAVAALNIPVISAIGHETDTTLIDYVADMRAPTPTAAAEMAVPVRRELLGNVQNLAAQLQQRIDGRIENNQLKLARYKQYFAQPERLLESPQQQLDMAIIGLSRSLRLTVEAKQQKLQNLTIRIVSPREIHLRQQTQLEHLQSRLIRGISQKAQQHKIHLQHVGQRLIAPENIHLQATERLQNNQNRLNHAMQNKYRFSADRLNGLKRLLESTSITRTFEQGFALVRDTEGKIVSSAQSARTAKKLVLRFADGSETVTIENG